MATIVQSEWAYFANGETDLSVSFSNPTQAGNSIVFVAMVPNGASASSSFAAPTDTQGLVFNKVAPDICEQGPLWQWTSPDTDTDAYYTVLTCCLATGTLAAGDTISFTIPSTVINGYVSAWVTIYEVQGTLLFDTSASNFGADPNTTVFSCGSISPATGYFEVAACAMAQSGFYDVNFTFGGEYVHQALNPLTAIIGALTYGETGCTFTGSSEFGGPFTLDTPTMGAIWAFTSASISGNVSGTGGNIAAVSYIGPSSGTVYTDGSGNYSISGLVNGTYTITPIYGDYVFTPANSIQTLAGANITGVDFATYSISGSLGTPESTVVEVAYSGPTSGSVYAHSDGTYTIPGLGPGAYTITPSSVGYAFSPTSHSETITSANLTGVNFTAMQVVTASGRFKFIERPSTTPGASLYDCVDSGNGKLVGQLFFDPIVRQAYSLNLRDNTPNISAGGADALQIQNFAAALPAPAGVTIVQPSNTPSTRFKFTSVVRRSGQAALAFLVSDGPSQAFGSIGEIIWDGTSGTNGAWTFLQTNAESEISSPNDVASITTFAASLALIAPNQISL